MRPGSQVGKDPAAPRRGRPPKRQTVIDAALRVFLDNGFTHAGVDAIAAEAGVSKQTIYNNFGDKKNLFTAVIREVQRQITAYAQERFGHFTETGDLERDLRAAGRLVVEMSLHGDVAALRRLIIAEQFRHPELVEEWARERPVFERTIAQEIERQEALGVLDVPDPLLAAHQLMVLVGNEAVSRSRFGLIPLSAGEIGTIVDNGVDMWLRAYRARPGAGAAPVSAEDSRTERC